MIHLYSAGRARPLAGQLAEVLAEPPDDPMTPEWLAVPSDGMRRWLTLELARHLGAGRAGAGDGIAANVIRAYPSTLRTQVLRAGADPDADPWAIERMVWSVLEVVEGHLTDPDLADFVALPPGASRFAKARRVADLFDRYHLHRPEMIRSWAEGRAVDGVGQALADEHRWQHRLWCLVREEVDEESPPERMPGRLERVRAGELTLDLPDRLVLFGFSVLPGVEFLDVAAAVAEHREVHLFLLEPGAFDATRLFDLFPPPAHGPRLRADDRTGDAVAQPLLRSWGRLPRETALLLATARAAGLPGPRRLDAEGRSASGDGSPPTLLGRLQQDILSNATPSGRPAAADRSVQFHACYGPMRQVQVARDALLHLLAAPDSDLTEEDIVVVCPSLDRFAPLIETVFGSAAGGPPAAPTTTDGAVGGTGAPHLRYRIADQSIRSANPVLSAAATLLELVSGRFETQAVLDALSLPPVRERFAFDDDDLATMDEWVRGTNVRWGIDPAHRARSGVPPAVTGNSWQGALDRLLLGSAVHDGDLGLAVGDVAPYGVEGSDVALLGRLAGFLGLAAGLAEQANSPRSIADWISILRGFLDTMVAAPRGEEWQTAALERILSLVLASATRDRPSGVPLTFVDIRRLFDEQLDGTPGRPDFFRGGITVTSLTPLRWVPHRVVCLLGLDQAAFAGPAPVAEDLVAAVPQVGDPDPRAESRLALLEVVLAAGDHLVVTRDGRDVRTNHPIPRSVVAAELFDAVLSVVAPEDRAAVADRLEVDHPRHPFDEPCLLPGRLVEGEVWSFAESDRRAAEARRHRAEGPPFLGQPLPPVEDRVIELAALHEFLADPVSMFVRRALGVRLPRDDAPVSSLLPVALTGLEQWDLGARLLRALLDGAPPDQWLEVERAAGSLPPGSLEHETMADIEGLVDELVAEAERRGVDRRPPDLAEIDVQLEDGTRVVGSVPLRLAGRSVGPARLQYTAVKPHHHLAAWLDLMVLLGSDPGDRWRSLVVGRSPRQGQDLEIIDLEPAPTLADPGDAARTALAVVVDCYRRGMREPLPIFRTLSRAVHLGSARPSDWQGHEYRGDARKAAVDLCFGDTDFDGIMGLPARPGDPSGRGGRVERYAHYLWDSVEATAVSVDPPEAGDPASEGVTG